MLPTIGILFAALTSFVVATVGYLDGWLPWWVTVPINAAVTFMMFTVLHDASHHYSISSVRRVNGLMSKLA